MSVPDGSENPIRPESARFECPACGTRALDITRKPSIYGGTTVLLHCFGCGGGLDEVSAATGLPRYRLLRWPPPKELGPPIQRRAAGRRIRQRQFSDASVDGWHSALWSDVFALGYLRELRGLSDETIRRFKLGYDSDRHAIVFPVQDMSGSLVAVKWRFLDPTADPKTRNSPGNASYFPPLGPEGAVLLGAGEMDALTARQWGLPGVTTTCGWPAGHLVPELGGRRVFLLPDVGEEDTAERVATRLIDVGGDPRIIVWPGGLPDKTDLNDWYVNHGGTRAHLLALARAARRL